MCVLWSFKRGSYNNKWIKKNKKIKISVHYLCLYDQNQFMRTSSSGIELLSRKWDNLIFTS